MTTNANSSATGLNHQIWSARGSQRSNIMQLAVSPKTTQSPVPADATTRP